MNATGETVHLELSISNYPYPSNDHVRLHAYSFEHVGEVEVYQSELIPSNLVGFTCRKRLTYSYRFASVHQIIRFVISYVDQNGGTFALAEAKIDLHDIIVQGGTVHLPVTHSDPQKGYEPLGNCVLTIKTDISDVRRRATVFMFGGNSLSSLSNHVIAPYFIMILVEGSEHDQQRKILLYRSETIQNEHNPRWKEFAVPTKYFEIYPTAYVEIQCYNYNVNAPDTLIGCFSTKYGQLLHGVGTINKYLLTNEDRMKKDNMDMELTKIEANHTFNDITNILTSRRTQLFMTVAIDFTANNGSPNVPNALHYLHPHISNAYTQAMSTVAQGFHRFDKRNRLSAFGFGAKRDNKLQQKFPLNVNGSQYVEGSHGLIDNYRKMLMNVLPFAPTDYSEVIYHVLTLAKASTRNRTNPLEFYFLLVIFTNGNLNDDQATVNALVESSYLPISVVFVPVYNQTHPMCGGDRMRLRRLLSPTLKTKGGMSMKRQIVSIIDEQLTPEAVLADVPRHIEQWTLLNNC
uniref:Copine domain-containing protein n=1 Tax=Steinernema glaseri TaxID=37863 RepID=A0A1I7XYC1_9BILA